jgi:hypothetical protein
MSRRFFIIFSQVMALTAADDAAATIPDCRDYAPLTRHTARPPRRFRVADIVYAGVSRSAPVAFFHATQRRRLSPLIFSLPPLLAPQRVLLMLAAGFSRGFRQPMRFSRCFRDAAAAASARAPPSRLPPRFQSFLSPPGFDRPPPIFFAEFLFSSPPMPIGAAIFRQIFS